MTPAALWLHRIGRLVDVACLAAIVVLAISAPGLMPLSALACAAMAVSDLVGTLLMRAESLGRDDIAGEMDRASTIARIVLYSYSAERLSHYGWHGWLAMMPILLVDKFATQVTTRLSRRMHPWTEHAPPVTTAPTETVPRPEHREKEEPAMGLLADIEKRFTIVPRVISDVETAARSQVGQALLDAGKIVLSLLPEGREAALVITKLEEAEQWAHKALAAGSTVLAEAEAGTAAVAADVPAASSPEASPPATA